MSDEHRDRLAGEALGALDASDSAELAAEVERDPALAAELDDYRHHRRHARVHGRARAAESRPVRGHPGARSSRSRPVALQRRPSRAGAGAARFLRSRSERRPLLPSSRSRSLSTRAARRELPTPSPRSRERRSSRACAARLASTARPSRAASSGSSSPTSRMPRTARTTRCGCFAPPRARRWRPSASSMRAAPRSSSSSGFPAPATTRRWTSPSSRTPARRSTPARASPAGVRASDDVASRGYNRASLGAIAQLEERLDRTQEVASSSLASSISECRSAGCREPAPTGRGTV